MLRLLVVSFFVFQLGQAVAEEPQKAPQAPVDATISAQETSGVNTSPILNLQADAGYTILALAFDQAAIELGADLYLGDRFFISLALHTTFDSFEEDTISRGGVRTEVQELFAGIGLGAGAYVTGNRFDGGLLLRGRYAFYAISADKVNDDVNLRIPGQVTQTPRIVYAEVGYEFKPRLGRNFYIEPALGVAVIVRKSRIDYPTINGVGTAATEMEGVNPWAGVSFGFKL